MAAEPADQLEAAYGALEAGEPVAALALFDQVVAALPEEPAARLGRGLALLQLDRAREAQQEVRLLKELAPGDRATHLLAARVAWQLGLVAQTQQAFERALALGGDDPDLLLEYADFLAIERGLRVAEEVAERAVREHPQAPRAWIALARVRWRQSRLAEAKPILQHALELDPNDPEAQALMTELLSVTGHDDEAAALASILGDTPGADGFVEAQREHAKERARTRMLIEREEFRKQVIGPSLIERWFRNFEVGWTILWVAVILGGVFLAVQSSNPLMIGPAAGALVGLWLFRKMLD